MGKGAERAVLLGLVGYAICQWVFLSTINHCRFFDRHRAAEVAGFHALTGALGGEVRTACSSGLIHHVLLTDADVVSPYLADQLPGEPGCTVVRETAVTPFDPAELLDCGSLVIVEEHLPAGTAAGQELPPGMRVEQAWASAESRYGYTAYRGGDCRRLPGQAGRVARPARPAAISQPGAAAIVAAPAAAYGDRHAARRAWDGGALGPRTLGARTG